MVRGQGGLGVTTCAFWSDDFDMDLLKVIPNVPEELGEYAERILWTVGNRDKRNGRLNHPVIWNTHGAFVWTVKPNLVRDGFGWFNVDGCVDDAEEIECTWLELLRDQWVHGFAFILKSISQVYFPGPPQEHFMTLMYHIRGWRQDDAAAEMARMAGRLWVVESTQRLKRALTRCDERSD